MPRFLVNMMKRRLLLTNFLDDMMTLKNFRHDKFKIFEYIQIFFPRMIFQILVCLPLRYKMDDQNILTLSVIIISYLLTLQQNLNKNV